MAIEARNISKKFGTFQALKNVDVIVPSGELIALLGPSGSGKTTLLRIIAGLEQADSGAVYFDGEDGEIIRAEPIPETLADRAREGRAHMLESLAMYSMSPRPRSFSAPTASRITREPPSRRTEAPPEKRSATRPPSPPTRRPRRARRHPAPTVARARGTALPLRPSGHRQAHRHPASGSGARRSSAVLTDGLLQGEDRIGDEPAGVG